MEKTTKEIMARLNILQEKGKRRLNASDRKNQINEMHILIKELHSRGEEKLINLLF